MFPIAGQTAGTNGKIFLVITYGWPGGVIGLKIYFFLKYFLFLIKFFSPRATPDPSAS